MDRSPEGAWRLFQAAAAFLILALFLAGLGDLYLGGFLSPFVLFWVLVVALVPFRSLPGHSLLLSLSAVLLFFWLLSTTGFILAPFILALVLSYILDPLVDWVEGPRIGRSLAILILAVPFLALLAVGIVFGVPALARQTGELIHNTPEFLARLADWLEAAQEKAIKVDLPLIREEELLDRLRSVDSAAVISFLEERREQIYSGIWSGVLGLGRGIGSFLSILGYVVLTPVLAFYLLRDWDGLMDRIAGLLPQEARERVLSLTAEYDELLARYLRGQVTVALIIGFLTAAGLLLLRFPYAILLGVLVAVFSVVPYMGLVLSLIPAIFIALVSGSVVISLVKIAVVYGATQALEGTVISPRILGDSVGLHPVWVVLALVLGGFFFGFVGLLLGVPMAVGVKLLAVRGVERYRNSDFFRGAPGLED